MNALNQGATPAGCPAANSHGCGSRSFIQSAHPGEQRNARLGMDIARRMSALRDWYGSGRIPRNNIQAQEWDRDSPPTDDCEAILFELIGGAHPF